MGWKAIGFEQKNLAELPIAAMNPFRVIEENGKIGVEHYFTTRRRVIIPAEYDYIEQVYVPAGIFFVVGINKKYGVYNSEGKLVVEVIYDKIYMENKIIVVRKRNCRGAYDYEGNHIVPDKYTAINAYEDYLRVRNFQSNFGAYDYEGNHIVPDKYVEYRTVKFDVGYEEFFMVKLWNGNCGLYNKKGKKLMLAIYDQIILCKKFIIANTSNSDFSSTVYSYDGTVILPRLEQYAYHSWNGVAIYYFQNGIKVCDAEGKEFEPGKVYEGVYAMHDEFLAVKFEGQWKILCSM